MLAQLLRRLLAGLAALGALLGSQLACEDGISRALVGVIGALCVPVLATAIAVLVSAMQSNAHENRRAWWRALLSETWISLRFFIARQPWVRTAAQVQEACTEPAQVPVLLVHGYVCNHRIWDTMTAALRAQGHTVLAIDLEPVFTSIDDYAAPIEQAVARLRQHTGAGQVALVGHSMGGLAIRAWMRVYGCEAASCVLTLGTPHAGTRIAPNAFSPNGAQMQWRSDWLQALAATEDAAARTLLRVAITAQDNIVFPQRHQVLAGVPATVFQGLGHLQLCVDPDVIAWVCRQLVTEPHGEASRAPQACV